MISVIGLAMKCSSCSSDLPDNLKFCPSCGTLFDKLSSPIQNNINNQAPVAPILVGPIGIGGWLILPIIGFFGAIILTAKNLLEILKEDNLEGLKLIYNSSTENSLASLQFPIILSTMAGCFIILSGVYCLYLVFTKKHSIIKFATAHYIILAIGGLIDLWGGIVLQTAIPDTPLEKETIKGAIQGIIAALVWIPYFNYSKRVKNTFIK
jgi:hypothetical protein